MCARSASPPCGSTGSRFGALFPTTCKYHPSCSQYAIDAVRQKGSLRGSLLAGWRLLRCNPWSHGGFDPVR